MLAAASHLAPGPYSDDDKLILAEYEAMIAELEAVGVQAPALNSGAAAHYVTFRRATDRYVTAYAENLAYRRAAVRSAYDLFTRRSVNTRIAAPRP